MNVWSMASSQQIDSFKVGERIRHLVVRVRGLSAPYIADNTKYEKFWFTVDNLGAEPAGREKIIQCTVQETAVGKFGPYIKPDGIICIKNTRVTENKHRAGNTPFSICMNNHSEMIVMNDSNDNDDPNPNRNSPRPGTSRATNTEVEKLPESPNTRIKRRTEDFLVELKEGLLQLSVHKRRKFELDTLYRMRNRLPDEN